LTAETGQDQRDCLARSFGFPRWTRPLFGKGDMDMETTIKEMIFWKDCKLHREPPSYYLQIITELSDCDTGPRSVTFEIPYPKANEVISEIFDLMARHKVEPTP
jgi:hypothetical protein